MATLDDIVAASKILAEGSETLVNGLGVKPEGEQVLVIDGKKNDDGGDEIAAVEDKGVGDGLSNGGEIVSVDVIGGDRVEFVGVVESDGKVEDGERGSGADLEVVGSDDVEVGGAGRNGSVGVDEGGKGEVEGIEREFRVGDLVWGKIKSHPWWPGQVYDEKDASDFAVKHSQEGRILVAFFGDCSCSWCLPSQLVPFVENFEEMSRDGSSKSFHNAIDRALEEVGRVKELSMTCNCVPEEKKVGLARPALRNAGIKAGVLVPEVDIDQLSLPDYEPSEVIAKLVQFAKFDSVGSALELAMLRSWLSAFYRFKGGHVLPSYREPTHVEGMEDKNPTVAERENDSGAAIEVPPRRPLGDDVPSPVSAGKPEVASGDKTYHRQKQKSIAELMGASGNKTTDLGKSSSVKKRKKTDDEEINGGGLEGASSNGRRGKKRRVEVVNEGRGEDAGTEGPLIRQPMQVDVAAADNNSGDAKEDVEMLSSPRERKKSRYLSPPYTNLASRIGNSSFKKKSETGSDKPGRLVEHEAGGDGGPLSPSPESVNVHDGKQEGLDSSVVNGESQTAEKDKRLSFPASDVDAPLDDLLVKIQSAAVDPLYLSRGGSLDTVSAFSLAHRSSTYLHGSDYKAYRRSLKGKKRKAGHLGTVVKEKMKSGDEITLKALQTEGKKKGKLKTRKLGEVSGAKNSAQKVQVKASRCLIVSFTPGSPLPSKEEIINLFGKFGKLNEKKTKVVPDLHLAKVLFLKEADAESALNSSISQSPFGLNVNYRLQRSSAPKSHPKASSSVDLKQAAADKPEGSGPSDDDLVLDVKGVKKKLEIMTAILENYHSEFSVEDRASLKEDFKQLMEKVATVSEKVETVSEKVRVAAECSKSQ